MDSDILKRARIVHEAISHELEKASALVDMGFYTEAALRLGRATEAALYAAARELGVPLNSQTIKALSKFKGMIDQNVTEILRTREITQVKRLAGVVAKLVETIADLSSDKTLLSGEDDESNVRPTEQLLRALMDSIDDPGVKEKLGKSQNVLRVVQKNRNSSAHASPDGSLREFTAEEYEEYRMKVEEFLLIVFNLVLGEQSRKRYEVASES